MADNIEPVFPKIYLFNLIMKTLFNFIYLQLQISLLKGNLQLAT